LAEGGDCLGVAGIEHHVQFGMGLGVVRLIALTRDEPPDRDLECAGDLPQRIQLRLALAGFDAGERGLAERCLGRQLILGNPSCNPQRPNAGADFLPTEIWVHHGLDYDTTVLRTDVT
jgi:hypothetical protein